MRKKLFAILMSAMMMVTFMPAMAFAAVSTPTATAKWAADYSKVEYTISYKVGDVAKTEKLEVAATREFQTSGDAVGMVKASHANVSGDAFAYKGFTTDEANALAAAVNTANKVKYFYDFTGAKILAASNLLLSNVTSKSDFARLFNATSGAFNGYGILMVQPAYTLVKATDTPKVAALHVTNSSSDDLKNMDIAWDKLADTTFDATSYAAQDVVVSGELTTYNEPDASESKPAVLGGYVVTDTAKIAAKNPTKDEVEKSDFYLDEVSAKTVVKATGHDDYTYDGAEHTVVMGNFPGLTVKYQLRNEQTKLYEDVDAVKIKKAGTYKFKAFVNDSTTTAAKELTFTVEVGKATASVQFVVNDADTETLTKNTFHVAENYNVVDYIEVAPDVTGAVDTPKEKANVAAAKADEATIMAFFAEYYDVTQTAKKFDASNVTAKISDKTDAAVKKAVETKYKDLLANYTNKFGATRYEANFILDKATDIEWTKAPLTKKYHNKKGTLKKTYTFAVEAKADSKVTYKLTNGGEMIKIDKNTGKVTVKKGLKVGTYKVYVTAKAGSSKDTYTLTIKMAKK